MQPAVESIDIAEDVAYVLNRNNHPDVFLLLKDKTGGGVMTDACHSRQK